MKNSGRVEAGKKLAEWNRLRKKQLQENALQQNTNAAALPTQSEGLKPEIDITPPKHVQPATHNLPVSHNALGVFVVIGLACIGYSLYKTYSPQIPTQTKIGGTQNTEQAATTPTKESRFDPFFMQ
jgi:hypothetical protein